LPCLSRAPPPGKAETALPDRSARIAAAVKTLIVKVGSSTVADDALELRRRLLAALVAALAEQVHGGARVVLVSSGAIACGQQVLGASERPREIPALQAASAVGQGRLFAHYERLFADQELTAAQVLLTSEDFARRSSYVNARNTLRRLLAWEVVPVVNENDTTATDEISFGDNDVLAAQVAIMLRADLLLLLTDRDGLYSSDPARDPAARLVARVGRPADLAGVDAGGHGRRGAGGMQGKTAAALMAAAAGVRTVIANGARAGVVADAVAGRSVGTLVVPQRAAAPAFKLWLRYAKPVRGTLEVDRGAALALTGAGGSLLPVGVVAAHGAFGAGDNVAIVGPDGVEIGRGLVSMSSRDVRRVLGLRSAEVQELAPQLEQEVVHRDCLVLVGEEDA
jgi:glutamate 5-kinase